MRRSERIIRVVRALQERPNQQISLSELAEEYGVAKSSLSEDVALIRDVLEADGAGTVVSLTGAGGGVLLRPRVPERDRQLFFADMCQRLSDSSRLLPGGFLYMSDILGDASVLDMAGRLFAERFQDSNANVVVTVETKGIPLACATAHYLNVPVVIVRRDHKVTDGAALTAHYVSGSERRIQTMSISKRALPPEARVLIVDDFMKAGATAKGVSSLVKEFASSVVGTAVFVTTSEPTGKLVPSPVALFTVGQLEEENEIQVWAQTDWRV
ncbi:pur operon repressor [Alicyclobacillus sp. SO9]|uniref:pur operon repressor n=1 Tax=Alicyclobacillus sp. SO9 TaxID=2665646 RepID=UPI0018E7C366|nr:pur operon repressor [Alicyclobacillus sp. SO9]QQE79401.1 pur operon repressor [Alicyclobacillus sp. SO9]